MEETKVQETSKGVFSFIDPRANIKGFLIFLVAAILVLGAVGFSVLDTSQQNTRKTTQKDNTSNFNSLASNTIVYGFWTGNETKIEAADLSTGKTYSLASIGADVKEVSVTSPDSIVFINKTNEQDHGQEIASYNFASKLTNSLISAAPGFGIDDYVLSPNRKYIALWEVSIPEGKALDEGISRVYAVDLQNPQAKKLIYDETLQQTTYAHYPVAVTDSGEVFMDTFQPNVGAGWAANGMSYSAFGGTPQPLNSVASGTYGTQPQMSPDGQYIAFGGYNGALGAGTVSTAASGGFRQAILSPNSVDVVSLSTKERKTFPGLSSQNRYSQVGWDQSSGKVLFSQLSRNADQTGMYFMGVNETAPQQINVAEKDKIYTVLSSLNTDKLLLASRDNSPTGLGNLGPSYAPSISEISVYDNATQKKTALQLNSGLVQFISLVPVKYFNEAYASGQVSEVGLKKESGDQLQLQTFTIKPSLEPVRTVQQSSPPADEKDLPNCRDTAAAQCNSLLGKSYTGDEARKLTGDTAYDQCFETNFYNGITETCSDSPLYLYGSRGTKVSIKINTEVSNAIPAYDNGYNATLLGDGQFEINKGTYSSISFDYVPATRKIRTPDYGRVVKKFELGSILSEYGKKLGLNDQEINDTISALSNKFNSEYVFVSFYDEETSKRMLPITFSPEPDVYRNIVFYLKPVKGQFSVNEPKFGVYPQRTGFTAVEVSYLVDFK